MIARRSGWFALLVIALLASSLPVLGATFAVTSNLDDGSVGTFRWALAQANATGGTDIITIPAMTITYTSAMPNVTESVEINGTGRELTIVQAFAHPRNPIAGVYRRLLQSSAVGVTMTIRDLTLRHGYMNTSGAAINASGPLIMERVAIRHNSVWDSPPTGGAVRAISEMYATDCVIEYNDVVYLLNVPSRGAGMHCQGFNTHLLRCTISNNIGTDNLSFLGGGLSIASSGGFTSIRECTIAGNNIRAAGTADGGGLYLSGSFSSLVIDSCTITGNSVQGASGSRGGGIFSPFTADNTGPVIRNTIIAGNTASTGTDVFQQVQSRGYNLIGNTSGGTVDDTGGSNTAVGNQLNVDPLLEVFAEHGGAMSVSRPSAASPALNMGTELDVTGTPFTTDQRGFPRISGAAADIGAIERDLDTPTVTGGIILDAGTTTDRDTVVFHVTFSEAMAAALTTANVTLTGSLAGAATVAVKGTSLSFDVVATMNNQYADGTIGISITGALADLEGNSLAVPVNSPMYTIRNVPGDTNDNGAVSAPELNTVVLWFRGLLS